MSHFAVTVITDTADGLDAALLPFHEYECTGIEEYTEFVPPNESDEELQKSFQNNKSDYGSFEQYMKDYHGYQRRDDGAWGRITNPNAKWDWWSIGGRWKGMLKTTNGTGVEGVSGVFNNESKPGTVDQCLIKDLDLDGMLKSIRQSNGDHWDKWETEFFEQCKKNNVVRDPIESLVTYREGCEKLRAKKSDKPLHELIKEDSEMNLLRNMCGDFFFNWDNRILELADRQKYIDSAKPFSTYAVLKNGEWYQRGEMGWWGMASNEVSEDEWDDQFDQLLRNISDDSVITIVDCHI